MAQDSQGIVLPQNRNSVTTTNPIWTGSSMTTSDGQSKTAADVTLWDKSGNPIGTQSSPFVTIDVAEGYAKNGQAFLGTSKPLSLTLAGNMRFLFLNPSGSGVTVNLGSIILINTTSAFIVSNFYVDPSSNLPSTAGAIINTNLINGGPSKSVIYADIGPSQMSGGSLVYSFLTPGGRTSLSDTPLILAAGHSIGFNLAFLGAGQGEVKVFFTES